MVVFPNAKINLGLNITSRLPNGYHTIETAFIPIPWSDVLEIVPGKTTETRLFTSGRPVDCPVEKNLVMKAYRKLDERFNLPALDIYLHKVVPDGAGLGGGSSDAAFTLKAINELLQLDLDNEELAEIAEEIGADCPFFIYNRPMLATGIGTTFEPADVNLNHMQIVIVKPPTRISTAVAYSQVSPALPERSLAEDLKANPTTWRSTLKNDFEASLWPRYPELAQIKNRLYDAGAVYASLSGSGSAVYGFFESDNLADVTSGWPTEYDIFCSRM